MPLKITVRSTQPLEASADLIVVGLFTTAPGRKLGGLSEPTAAIDRALGGGLAKLIARDEFSAKKDQTLSVATLGRMSADRIVLVGLGERANLTDADVRTFAAKAARVANTEKAKSLLLLLPDGFNLRFRYVAEGLELGAYRFTKYLTGDRRPKQLLASVTLGFEGKAPTSAKAEIALGQKVGGAVNLARDLSNEPPNMLTPMLLAAAAQKMGKANGVKVQVFDMKEIQRRGMKLLQAVGQGSANDPRFVHMAFGTAKKGRKRLVFVGKGITFDSGGLSIKPAAGMGDMKHDMSGAANMVGLMAAVAALKPDVEVHALIAAAENMPDGNAYRPGDIWGSLDGKSVEIINTDAEGRLVLADALAYAAALKPDLLVDNATLTGACVVALGTTCSGYFSNNEETATEFAAALKASGEPMWRMPLLEELKDQLKSDVADLKHTGDRWGGSITAALFLREFIGGTKNWVHADIAGPASAERASGWNPKGATGHGVLTFVSLVERAAR